MTRSRRYLIEYGTLATLPLDSFFKGVSDGTRGEVGLPANANFVKHDEHAR